MRCAALALVIAGALCGPLGCGEGASGPERRAGKSDGALVVLLPRPPESLDPRHVFDAYGLRLSRLVFASLVEMDPETLTPVPELAESVSFASPTEVRVRLRPGLRFSDGSTLDADDVRATFEGIRDPAVKSRYARTYERIVSIDTPDPRTVVFHLDGPHAPFLTDLELPVLRAEDAHGPAMAPGALVGAGPFRLAETSVSEVTFAANPHWHRGAPRVPAVRFVVVRDDNTRAMRLEAGGADVAVGAIPPLLLPMFSDPGRFSVERAPGIGTTYLGFNTERGLFRDVRARRAVAHSIDRRALVDAKLLGYGELASSWVPSGHWAHSESQASLARDALRYDAARARALFGQAAARGPGEADARVVLRTGTDRARLSACFALRAMLGAAGLEVEVQPSETASLLSDLGKGRFDMVLLTVPEFFEPHLFSWFFASERIPGPGGEGANRWRYRNPVVDAALERGRVAVDVPTRRAAYADVTAALLRDLPVVPLWHEDVVLVRRASAPRFRVPRDGRFGFLAR